LFERHPSRQLPPIVALSVEINDASAADALEASALDCLAKTDGDLRLVARILRSAIGLHRLKREPRPTAERFEL
jgi:hypothetical protein